MKRLLSIPLAAAVACLVLAASSCLSTPTAMPAPTPGEESLADLIAAGRVSEVRSRFANSSALNQKDAAGQSLLHVAALKNDAEMVRLLIELKADPDIRDNVGDTPLSASIQAGCLDAARALAEGNASVFSANAAGRPVHALAREKGADSFAAILSARTVAQRDEAGRTLLHHAALSLDEAAVTAVLRAGADLSARDASGVSPLAASYLKPERPESARIAAQLLLAGAEPTRGPFAYFETAVLKRNLSMRLEDGQTPLHLAARQGHSGYVQYLLERKAQANVKDVSSSTPLHEAVRNGRIECTALLLAAGADPNVTDSSGNTPLHLVMPAASRSEIFGRLLAAGADPNAKDSYGETPLHIAARLGMSDDIPRALLKAGADINERNKKGVTPLSLAIERSQTAQAALFVALGADIHAEDIEGNTALTKAFRAGREMVQAILTEGNVQTRDSQGRTPLHVAVVSRAEPAVLAYIISLKADVNARDKNGDSPLHVAVRNNDRASGEVLLARGADVFYPNVSGESALKAALTRMGGREDWVLNSAVIKSSDGAGNTPLHLAAEWQLNQVVGFITEKGGDLNARNANGETPIFGAVKADSSQTIQAILRAGGSRKADVNARDFLGNTALHACIRWAAGDAAGALIAFDAQYNGKKLINARNLAGKTALHDASRTGNLAFARALLAAGADINAIDETGKTALTDAIQAGRVDAVRLLLDKGASPVMQDMYGRNAFHEAVEFAGDEIIVMMRNAGGNPMSRDSYGKTPLSLAFRKSTATVMAVIGSNTNLVDSDGNTPLHIAVAERGSEEALQTLIAARFPVNNRNRMGATALVQAILSGQEGLARVLLAAGADPYAADNSGQCAVSIALTGSKGFVPVLAEYAAGKTDTIGDGILHYAARIADRETVTRLLTLPRVDRADRNIAGETAYDIAVRWQRPEIAELLK